LEARNERSCPNVESRDVRFTARSASVSALVVATATAIAVTGAPTPTPTPAVASISAADYRLLTEREAASERATRDKARKAVVVKKTAAAPKPKPAAKKTAAPKPKPKPAAAKKPVAKKTVEVQRSTASSWKLPPRLKGVKASSDKYRAYALKLVGPSQFSCLDKLWTKESHWNPRSDNPTSSAYGIPQILGLTSSDGFYQVDRGLKYIKHSVQGHGTPCAAWSAWLSKGWY
jgi:hypothetical protein